MKAIINIRQYGTEIGIGLLLAGLYVVSYYNYLLFHSISEIFSIVIGSALFVVAWNTRRLLDNRYFLFIGISYLFVAFLDLIHLFSYKGMGVFPSNEADMPTQLWIAARYMESISLLLATLFIPKKLPAGITFSIFFVVTALLLASINLGYFPPCFVEGEGLTPFKIYSEYLICAILSAALGMLIMNRARFDRNVLILIIASIGMTIVSELAFTFYVSVYGISNMVGHYFKIISFYLMYRAVVVTGLVKPYDLLFRNLKESEATLRVKSEQLESANKELETFAYSVSHDLRAPLRAIDGFSNMLLNDIGGKLDPESRRKFNVIRDNAQKMDKLINDVLNFSRTGRAEISPSPIDMKSLAREVWNELRAGNPDRNMELIIDGLPSAVGDRVLIRQVLSNLLGNAVKFTRNTGHAVIELKGDNSGTYSKYYIKDNGVGFDMRYSDKLFEIFRRIHKEKDFEGTGVGLAIVKKIIDKHGGRIWAESEPGKGAIFYFTLPAGQ